MYMATINISLPTKMAKTINQLSRTRGYASRSELIRDLLREKLNQESAQFEVFDKRSLSQIRRELTKTGKYNKQFIESVVKGFKQSSVYGRD